MDKTNKRPGNVKRTKKKDINGIDVPLNLASTTYTPNTKLTYWLGMSSTVAKTVVSDFDVINLGTIGISKNAVNSLASYIGISRKYIAENLFDVSVKTLERKDSKTKLDRKTSSHAVEIAKVVQHAYQVFRDEEKVKRWLNKENRALNNLKPVELFATLSGLSMVNDILGRIEEGVYS